MGIPEEDKGPAWLRDYGENSGHLTTDNRFGYQHENGTFAVDLKGLKDFGTKLHTELELDYVPHMKTAEEDMTVMPSVLPDRFLELVDVVTHQNTKLHEVLGTLKNHSKAVQTLASVAKDLAEKYGNTDALAATRVADVEAALAPPPAVLTNGTTPSTPVNAASVPVKSEPTGDGYE